MSQDAIDPSLLSFVPSNQFTASNTRPRPLAPDSISNQGQASLGGGAQASETKEERRRYTPEEDAKLCQLKQEGKGRQHIAKLLGRSINSISHRSTVLRDKGLIPLYVRGKSPVISVRALDRASPLVIGLTFSKSVSFSVANQAPTPAAFPEIANAKDHRTTSIEDKATEFQEQGSSLTASDTPPPTIFKDKLTSSQLSKGYGRSYSAAEDAKIGELFNVGKSNQEIAGSLSRSKQAIGNRICTLRNQGILPRIRGILGSPSQAVRSTAASPSTTPSPLLLNSAQSTNPTTSLSAVSSARPVSIDAIPFTPEDDHVILQLYTTLPGQFKKISRRMQPTRHKNEVKARYEMLLATKGKSGSSESSSDDESPRRQEIRSTTFLPIDPFLSTAADSFTESIVTRSGFNAAARSAPSQPSVNSRFSSTSVSSFPAIQHPHLSPISQYSLPVAASTYLTPSKRRTSADSLRSSSPQKRQAFTSMSNNSTLNLPSPDRPVLDYAQLLELAIETLEGYGEQGSRATGGFASSKGRESEQGKENETI